LLNKLVNRRVINRNRSLCYESHSPLWFKIFRVITLTVSCASEAEKQGISINDRKYIIKALLKANPAVGFGKATTARPHLVWWRNVYPIQLLNAKLEVSTVIKIRPWSYGLWRRVLIRRTPMLYIN